MTSTKPSPGSIASLLSTNRFSKIPENPRNQPDLILCDVSPLGLVLGKELDIPTVLVENFTWDWIYGAYLNEEPRFAPFIERLHELFDSADLRIQTKPICERIENCPLVSPIFREFREPAARILDRLGLPSDSRYLLVTTGGIPQDFLPRQAQRQTGSPFRNHRKLPPFERTETSSFFLTARVYISPTSFGHPAESWESRIWDGGRDLGPKFLSLRSTARISELKLQTSRRTMQTLLLRKATFSTESGSNDSTNFSLCPRLAGKTGPTGQGSMPIRQHLINRCNRLATY